MKHFILLFAILAFLGSCDNAEDVPNPFNDTYPVKFVFDSIVNISPFYYYTNDAEGESDVIIRRWEVEEWMRRKAKQVESIQLLNSNAAKIAGYDKNDPPNPFTLEFKYTLNAPVYHFSASLFSQTLDYDADRVGNDLILKGLSGIIYRNGSLYKESTTIQVSGYKLSDLKTFVEPGDTLYYKLFDIRLIKN